MRRYANLGALRLKDRVSRLQVTERVSANAAELRLK